MWITENFVALLAFLIIRVSTQSNSIVEQIRLNEHYELFCPESQFKLERILFKRSINPLNVTNFHVTKLVHYFNDAFIEKIEPLVFESIHFNDSGRYFCLFKNEDYYFIKSILLLVYDIEQKAALVGDKITLFTNDFSSNSNDLIWSIGSEFLKTDNKFFFINELTKDLTINLANLSLFDTYRLNNIQSGEYILFDILTPLTNSKTKRAPLIEPTNLTIPAQSSALFECINRNLNDEPDNYQWYKMGKNEDDKYDELYVNRTYSINHTELEVKYSSVLMATGKTLALNYLQLDDSGWYFCCLVYSMDFNDDIEPLMSCSSAFLDVQSDPNVISIKEHGHITNKSEKTTKRLTAIAILFVLSTILVGVLSILAVVFLYKKLRTINYAEKGRRFMAKNEFYHSKNLLDSGEAQNLFPEYTPYDLIQEKLGQKNVEKWEIPLKSLKLGHTLGVGAFGLVMYAEEFIDNHKQRVVAVKKLKENASANTFIEFLSELKLMIDVDNHENIINLIGYSINKTNNSLYIVTEYCQYGNLKDYLRKYHELTNKCYDHTTLYAYQIAKGMQYLHAKEILHRDLAARNILVHDYNLVKIADFGLARNVTSDYYYIQQADGRFPIKWMAIESLTHNKISKKSDVWSFAVLLWEIYSYGCSPYPSVPPENILKYILSGNRLEKPQDCENSIYNLMLTCWSLNESDRPSFDYIQSQFEILMNELVWTVKDANLLMANSIVCKTTSSSSTYPDSNSTEYTIASLSCKNIPEDAEAFIDDEYCNVADALGTRFDKTINTHELDNF